MAASDVGARPYYVYVLFRHDTGAPFYVGKGKGRRWATHENLSRHDKNRHKQRIIKKALDAVYGVPRVKIAQHLSEQDAFAVERAFICSIGRIANGGPLVNQSDGGEGQSGFQQTPEAKAKAAATRAANGPRQISERQRAASRLTGLANRGRIMPPHFSSVISAANKGRRHTDEAKARIGAKHRGKVMSQEAREKIGRASLGRRPSEETREKLRQASTGRRHSEEALQKISRIFLGRHHTPEAKAKISAANSGRRMKPEQKAQVSENLRKRAPLSPETRDKLSAWQKGRKRSAEDKQKMKDGWAKRKAALLAAQQ